MLPPLPGAPSPIQKSSYFTHRVQLYSFTSQNLSETQSHSHSSSHLISTYHIISNYSRIHISSHSPPHPSYPCDLNVLSIHLYYPHLIVLTLYIYPHLILSSPLLSPHPRRVSSCHVISSCQCVILHMSSCHVSTCHDIVSYHIHYHYVFTFVT